MPAKVATVINYCTNEYRFIRCCVTAVAPFSAQILVPVADHFFDGAPEDPALLARTAAENPEATLLPYAWTPGHAPRYWHNYSRLVGAQHLSADVDWVLFLDADEIVDTALFVQFAERLRGSECRSYKLANYWYFRAPIYRATALEDSAVVVRKALAGRIELESRKEREQFVHRSTPRLVTVDGRPIVHHFSWVRTKEEMLKKVRSWGHRGDRKWEARVEEEFSRPFNGRCFVHDYEFVTVDDRFGLGEPAVGV
jgi:hypothetical protein